jgi:sugar phosphate isomerase/epimerase
MIFFRNRFSLPVYCIGLFMTIAAACKTIGHGSTSSAGQPEERLGWKLGTQAFTFNRYSFSEAVAKTDSCNLGYIEAFPGQEIGGGIEGKMDYNMEPAKRVEILKMLKKKHIRMAAFGVISAGNEPEWIRIFEFCKAMGVETITSDPDEKDMQLLSGLCDRYQINLAIHNHAKPSRYWSPEIVMNAIKGKSKRLGLCADLGHWMHSGLDALDCIKNADGHVLHLHMKDLNGKSEGSHDVHWGTGATNIDAVIKELKRQGFKGIISAEYEYNWNNNTADVAKSVAYFRESLKKTLTTK